jgi:hypothetical protein
VFRLRTDIKEGPVYWVEFFCVDVTERLRRRNIKIRPLKLAHPDEPSMKKPLECRYHVHKDHRSELISVQWG